MKNKYFLCSTTMNKLKDDMSFYRQNSELLAIWSVIYTAMAILIVTSFGNGLFYLLFSVFVGLLITAILSFLTINYLYYKKKMKNANSLIIFGKLLSHPINIA